MIELQGEVAGVYRCKTSVCAAFLPSSERISMKHIFKDKLIDQKSDLE